MAVYDLEEQEQIDEFKAWWNQYRNLVTLLVVAALLTIGSARLLRVGRFARSSVH